MLKKYINTYYTKPNIYLNPKFERLKSVLS